MVVAPVVRAALIVEHVLELLDHIVLEVERQVLVAFVTQRIWNMNWIGSDSNGFGI